MHALKHPDRQTDTNTHTHTHEVEESEGEEVGAAMAAVRLE